MSSTSEEAELERTSSTSDETDGDSRMRPTRLSRIMSVGSNMSVPSWAPPWPHAASRVEADSRRAPGEGGGAIAGTPVGWAGWLARELCSEAERARAAKEWRCCSRLPASASSERLAPEEALRRRDRRLETDEDEARPESEVEERLGGSASPASAAAAVLIGALTRTEAVNASFSIGQSSQAVPGGLGAAASGDIHWDDEFLRLRGPEVYRRPLSGVSVERAVEWLRLWARDFLKDGQRLTTPVEIENVADGVTLRFLQPGGVGYDLDFDKEETTEERFAASKAASREGRAKSRGSPDGALLVVAEAQPYPRVRVARAEMGEGVVPKEMSELAVLERLERGLRGLDG